MAIYLSLLIAVVGAVVYLVAAHSKGAELARLAFAVGLLAFLLSAREVVARLS